MDELAASHEQPLAARTPFPAIRRAIAHGLLPAEVVPRDVVHLLQAPDWRDAVERLLLRPATRAEVRELARLVATMPPGARWLPLRLYRIIAAGDGPADELLALLRVALDDAARWTAKKWTLADSDQLCRLVARAAPAVRGLLTSQLVASPIEAACIARQVAELRDSDLPSPRQLTAVVDGVEDVAAMIRRRWQADNADRPVPETFRRFHGFQTSNRWQLAVPRDLTDIQDWARAMDNCLADEYAWRILREEAFVVGLVPPGRTLQDTATPTLLAELDPDATTLFALLGAHNRLPTAREAFGAWNALANAGLLPPGTVASLPSVEAVDRALRVSAEDGMDHWTLPQRRIAADVLWKGGYHRSPLDVDTVVDSAMRVRVAGATIPGHVIIDSPAG